jgi:aspartyl-tRNA(Asn)/glutamyl-tRNA(Gln) amidotransferase subunit B
LEHNVSRVVSVLDRYPDYEVVIGMEVHVQLTTKTKIFCSSVNTPHAEPNEHICPICTGYPGILPVFNEAVVNAAIAAGIATNCTIAERSLFDRKHYFYPDLPKGYQITQQFNPICTQGYIPIRLDNSSIKKIRINRIHIEEDAGKNIHADSAAASFVNLNRAGTPLLEIVSEPDIASAEETKLYLKTLRAIVQYLDICSGNMEDGAFRADTNISVRKKGATQLGTKCELKNINSFKYIFDAVEYEIERQINVLKEGGFVRQETRLWDSVNKRTLIMRVKEEAIDYRYMPDPDLPTIDLDAAWIDKITKSLPELPYNKFDRFVKDNLLTPYEADILVENLSLATYYDEAASYTKSKSIINWILRDIISYINEHNTPLANCFMTPKRLAALVDLVDQGVINSSAAQKLFARVIETGKEPLVVLEELGLRQIGSVDELEVIVKKIIADNPEVVIQYKAGKERLFGFFVGQAMQATKGKGNPTILSDLLKKHLA